ncbi:uncharacterized protein LOC134266962 [Saccostrea cucullata]|uniref:uncharacterized protein LOC134266962 n=1 Tax=Saccostrea cuccullata TaxID=36930 RepID=UPI002ED47D9C
MHKLRFNTPCKVRQCSQCQGDTEYYCNTCKQDLCLQCKERHVIDLETIQHDVAIYRERYEYIPKYETCVRHPDRICHIYCNSCKCPVCTRCIEHREHEIQDIVSSYETNRQQYRDIIHYIRSETLFNSCVLLTEIKTDLKSCHAEISNIQSDMSAKAQIIKQLFDTVIRDVKIRNTCYLMQRIKQHEHRLYKDLAKIEIYEHKSETLAEKPIKLLLLLKKSCIPKSKDRCYLRQHTLLSLTEKSQHEVLKKLLKEIQFIERGQRYVRKDSLLKLISTPVLHRTVMVTGVKGVFHVCFVTPDQVWITDYDNFLLINTKGDILHQPTDKSTYYGGSNTVTITGDLLYIDKDYNINKLSKDNRNKSILIKKTTKWRPLCVYCSPNNGDLLIGMDDTDTYTARVARYNAKGVHLHTIQHSSTGQELYTDPVYITENSNGDIIVSDIDCDAVVVTELEGRFRFSYTGPPSGFGLRPWGICTDALSHILVSDYYTSTIHMIDKDGNFLSLIQKDQPEIDRPWGLGYDDTYHLLWVGSWISNKVCKYRHTERQNY